MRLRKALVASATATALLVSGPAIATAQETPAASSASNWSEALLGSSMDENGKVSPKEITNWLRVFERLIKAFDSLLSFKL
ncbi:hypothetical protein [Corynebacterium lizhenjunii]|uniref:hypothetical protein n=1 Tax=Corynebacterium lizhenjunii TaxID=2709394 RepID=UPI0013EB60E3|nr:hypothetical protein [Corynebacterium lizhenjunii]